MDGATQDSIQWVAWAGMVLGLGCLLLGGVSLVAFQGRQRGATLITAGVLLVVGGVVLPRLLWALLDPGQSPRPDPAASGPADATPDLTFDAPSWSLGVGVALAGALIAGAILVATVAPLVRARRRQRRRAQDALWRVREEWQRWLARYHAVDQDFLAFDRDLELVLRYPLMRDYRQPETIALIEAMSTCRPLATSTPPPDVTDVATSEFAQAVTVYEHAYARALATAGRAHAARLSAQELAAIRLAQQLLALAHDSAASPAERRAAYTRIIKTLSGFLTLDGAHFLELEAPAAPLAITTG